MITHACFPRNQKAEAGYLAQFPGHPELRRENLPQRECSLYIFTCYSIMTEQCLQWIKKYLHAVSSALYWSKAQCAVFHRRERKMEGEGE